MVRTKPLWLLAPAVLGLAVFITACGGSGLDIVPGGATDGSSNGNGGGASGDASPGTSWNAATDPNVQSIEIYANYDNGVTLGIGETLPIRAIVYVTGGQESSTAEVGWISSDTSIFTVRSLAPGEPRKCQITGVKAGTARLTAFNGAVRSPALDIHVGDSAFPVPPPG